MTGTLESIAPFAIMRDKRRKDSRVANKMKRSGSQFDIPTAELSSCTYRIYTNLVNDEAKSEGP